MNFTSIPIGMSYRGYSPSNSGFPSENLDRLYDITSIVDSFENGSFFTTYGRSLEQQFNVNIEKELDNVVLWLDGDFIPCMLNEARKYDYRKLEECAKKTESIRSRLAKVCKFLNFCKSTVQLTEHNILSNTYKQAITVEIGRDVNAWNCLQQYEHVEEMLSEVGATATREMDETSHNGDGVLAAVNSLEKPELDLATCCLLANDRANFKFNFSLAYDPMIENLLYLRKGMPGVRDIDRFGQPTIQFKTPILFACLLCCREVPLCSRVSHNVIREHVVGHKHKKKKRHSPAISALSAYHRHWIQLELKYQAHQVYFLPLNLSEAVCTLCCTSVSYDLVELHIQKGAHPEKVFQLYQSDSNKTHLSELQLAVYASNDEDCSSQLDDSEDVASEQMQRVVQRRLEGAEKEELETDDSDVSTEEKKNVEPKLSEMYSLQPTAASAKIKGHNVIKSVANPAGKELGDLLEYRLLPHLKLFTKVNENLVDCYCCQMMLPNQIADIKEHIFSKKHHSNANIPFVHYVFYCEICNMFFKQNDRWIDHLKLLKHTERCDKLGAARKNKMTEYECKNCKLVIFGDDLSVRRHLSSSGGRGIRVRRTKELTLGAEVKSLLMSEAFIQEYSLQLASDAYEVLLNQEPVKQCCRALEVALTNTYPNCKAYPFGSRVSGLGSMKSDLDIFMDVGDMYLGDKNQDSSSQEKFVNVACKAYRKKRDEFSHVNPIPTARTPIVQVYHVHTRLDCDLSFRHGLSVENTKFLKLCIELQPVTQHLILLLKKWTDYCKLQEHITTYALSMMVIFHLQVIGYLMPVHELRQLNPEKVLVVDGWGVVDFSNISMATIRERIVPYAGSVKELLQKFFAYYTSFHYVTDVICPLLGRPIKKALFVDKPKGEDLPLEMLAYVQKISANDADCFRARSPFCIQDPFDLSHNLVKVCTFNVLHKLATFCDLTFKHLSTVH